MRILHVPCNEYGKPMPHMSLFSDRFLNHLGPMPHMPFFSDRFPNHQYLTNI